MKNHLFIFLLLFFMVANAQEETSYKKMAVYPGCEQYKGNKTLISCFGKALSTDLRMMLDTSVPRSPVSDLRLPLREFRVVISFIVTHEGKIEEVAFEEGNRQFRDQALEAMNSLVNFMEVTNIRIQPALDLEGMPVGMRFHAPIVLTNPNPREY